MKHTFRGATVTRDTNGAVTLNLYVSNAPKARYEVSQLAAGIEYEADIKRYKNRRSLSANAYAWQLIGQLSAVLGIPPVELYRAYIPDVGDNFKAVHIEDDKVREEYGHLWSLQGQGWVAHDMGCGDMLCYYGSSTYNTAQMARLIDFIVDDCKAQGIETETPDKISGMVERWAAHEAR